MRTSPPITVALAEDSPAVRAALVALIEAESGLQLVGTGVDAHEIAALCGAVRPRVAVVDAKMPGGGGVAATRAILASSPSTQVVAYTAHADRTTRADLVDAGAFAIVQKGGPIEALLDAIVAAAAMQDGVV